MGFTNRTCAAINDSTIETDDPFFDGNWDAHKIGWLIAGVCALVVSLVWGSLTNARTGAEPEAVQPCAARPLPSSHHTIRSVGLEAELMTGLAMSIVYVGIWYFILDACAQLLQAKAAAPDPRKFPV